MTAEEKAEKYATENLPDGYTKVNYEKKESYLAGFAEGRKESIEETKQIESVSDFLPIENPKSKWYVTKELIESKIKDKKFTKNCGKKAAVPLGRLMNCHTTNLDFQCNLSKFFQKIIVN